MSEEPKALTPEEGRIVKAAAAARYAERGIRPATAEYIFNRYMHKLAIQAGIVKAPEAKPNNAMKLAEALRPIVAKAAAVRLKGQKYPIGNVKNKLPATAAPAKKPVKPVVA